MIGTHRISMPDFDCGIGDRLAVVQALMDTASNGDRRPGKPVLFKLPSFTAPVPDILYGPSVTSTERPQFAHSATERTVTSGGSEPKRIQAATIAKARIATPPQKLIFLRAPRIQATAWLGKSVALA
jgi:hypothetical protein